MEGNYALKLIKRADYCALTSLDTGLDVAHVAYSLMYVHVAWSWPVAVARAAYSRALVRRHAVEGGARAGGAWRACVSLPNPTRNMACMLNMTVLPCQLSSSPA